MAARLSSVSVVSEYCSATPLLPPARTPLQSIRWFNLAPRSSTVLNSRLQKLSPTIVCAAGLGGISLGSVFKSCETCSGKRAIECPGCKGTGKNKKNGNIFERWKCFDCQGFGLKSCPQCGQGGLTPEQRGER